MKTLRLSVILFFISALSNTLFDAQVDEKSGKGIGAEPECDYAALTDSL
jgi:hypothetical protein